MSGPAARFAVVGDALLDVSVRHRAALELGGDVPAEVLIGPGGQGANVAVRLARLGADVTLAAALGADRAGEMLRTALEREGVALALVPTTATGTVVVLTDGSGERTMLSQRVPFAEDAFLPPGADWIVVSGYALLEPAGPRLAGRLGAAPARRVLLGCAVPDGGEARWRDAARRLDPNLAILNRAEAAALGPSVPDGPEPLAVAAATALGCSVVVTAARAAVAVIDGGAPVMVRGGAAVPPVDTTGAGDAFAASLLAQLADLPWPPPREACEVALAAAMSHAAAVTRVTGAQTHVPDEGPAPAERDAAPVS